jgi:hypothetical protein
VKFLDSPKTSSDAGNCTVETEQIPDRPAIGRYRKAGAAG